MLSLGYLNPVAIELKRGINNNQLKHIRQLPHVLPTGIPCIDTHTRRCCSLAPPPPPSPPAPPCPAHITSPRVEQGKGVPTMTGHVWITVVVLLIALSAKGAVAATTCETEATDCNDGYFLDTTHNFATSPAPIMCDGIKCNNLLQQHADCCVRNLKCTNTAFDDGAYCPYGYVPVTVTTVAAQVSALPTVEACCARDTTVASFPVCTDVASGRVGAVQASTPDDASWAVQDGNGFTRTVGKFTGMCFTIRIDDSDCTVGHKCCTAKPPAYLQFKVGTAPGTGCKVSYGTAVANVNSLKRITKWLTVGSVTADTASYFNVPVTWKKGSKTGTACIYSLVTPAATNCMLESICGVNAGGDVPDLNGNYDKGCELRLVGRKSAASAACCAPTFSVTSFDSTEENRLAGGAPASGNIELQGV